MKASALAGSWGMTAVKSERVVDHHSSSSSSRAHSLGSPCFCSLSLSWGHETTLSTSQRYIADTAVLKTLWPADLDCLSGRIAFYKWASLLNDDIPFVSNSVLRSLFHDTAIWQWALMDRGRRCHQILLILKTNGSWSRMSKQENNHLSFSLSLPFVSRASKRWWKKRSLFIRYWGHQRDT